ncbi:unnamed protein product [Amoebophrya sp. A25]|nr:unnamed protein product [Amoebophrya sp. A25]|eukprot:GSA25T00013226001.1
MDPQQFLGSRVLQWQAPGGLLGRLKARRGASGQSSQQSSILRTSPVRCDYPLPWRFDWGGHDPATPTMELSITLHNSMYALFAGITYFIGHTSLRSCSKFQKIMEKLQINCRPYVLRFY